MPKFRDSTAFAILLLLIAMLSIQSGAAIAKSLFPKVGSLGTSAFRLGFAALILLAIWRPWRKLTRNELKPIALYGLALGAMNLTFYLAIARIPLGLAVGIEFTGPLAVSLFASKTPRDFVWALLAAIGILLILPLTNFSAPIDPIGVAYAFLAAVGWALYIIFGQKAGGSIGTGLVTSAGMAVAALLVLPIGIADAGALMLDASLLPAALGVALFSSALPYSIEMVALKRISSKKFGILMSLEPAIGALSGLVFLSEHLAFVQWIALGFIILASAGAAASADTKVRSASPIEGG